MELETHTTTCPTCHQPRESIAGGQIREARERAGLTLRHLAGIAGISAPYLSDLELGRRNLTEARAVTLLELIEAAE